MKREREMSRAFRKTFVGREVSVLFEECIERADGSWWIGHTPHYVKVAYKAQEKMKETQSGGDHETAQCLANRIVPCQILSFLDEDVMLAKAAHT